MSLAHINSRLSVNTINSISKDCIFFLGPTGDEFVDYFGNTPTTKYGTFSQQNEFNYGIEIPKITTNLLSDPFFETGANYSIDTFDKLQWISNMQNPISNKYGVLYLYKAASSGKFVSRSTNIQKIKHTTSAIVKILKGNINNVNVGGTIWYTDSSYTDYTWTNTNTSRFKYTCSEENVYLLKATIEPNMSKTINYYQQRISYNGSDECELLVYAVQTEVGTESSLIANGQRSQGMLKYNLPNKFNSSEGTISLFLTCLYDYSARNMVELNPKFIQIGPHYYNSSITLWQNGGNLELKARGISYQDWTGSISYQFAPEYRKTYHIAATWNGTNIKLYIDGNCVASGNMIEPLGEIYNNIMFIGGEGDGSTGEGDKAQSILSNIAIYSRELSEFEIQQIANNKSFYSNMIKAGVAI